MYYVCTKVKSKTEKQASQLRCGERGIHFPLNLLQFVA